MLEADSPLRASAFPLIVPLLVPLELNAIVDDYFSGGYDYFVQQKVVPMSNYEVAALWKVYRKQTVLSHTPVNEKCKFCFFKI